MEVLVLAVVIGIAILITNQPDDDRTACINVASWIAVAVLFMALLTAASLIGLALPGAR